MPTHSHRTRTAKCEGCGKEFESKSVHLGLGRWTKFCSRKCARKNSAWRKFTVK